MLPTLLFLSPLVLRSRAVLFTDPSELPDNVTYDFIVIGGALNHAPLNTTSNDRFSTGGTAGSVVASRLTEIATVNVLIIECGTSQVLSALTGITLTYGNIQGFCNIIENSGICR